MGCAAMLLVVAGLGSGCGRTGPGLDGFPASPRGEPVVPRPDGAPPFDAGPPDAPPPADAACVPAGDEVCNGRDDDCDGRVDDVRPVMCPGGGSRYCVGGRFSACPRRCDVCIPGAERVCFVNYCTYWGVQTCTADGMAMGPCVEERAPAECLDIALAEHDSPELEQCCIDNGHCCKDRHDLDRDGDRAESLGACEEVTCETP